MRVRRIAFWSVLLIAIAACVAWVLYVPYKPESVLAAIPAEADFVSVHRNLAAGLPLLLENGVAHGMGSAAGFSVQQLAGVSSNQVAMTWIRRLARDSTAIAYVPALGRSQAPAWVFASWIGNQSQKLRWKVFWFHPRILRTTAAEYGRTVYAVRMRTGDPRQQLSVAVVEGVLVGCLSEDPTAARYLVQTFDRQFGRRSLAADPGFRAAGLRVATDQVHRGWIRVRRNPLAAGSTPSILACELHLPDRNHLQARFSLPGSLPRIAGRAADPFPAGFLGAAPDCALVLPASWINAFLPDSPAVPLWVTTLQPLLANNATNAMVFAAILNRAHCGRIRGPLGDSLTPFLKGLRVPTLVVGLQVQDAGEASRRVMESLDCINSRYGLGLIPHPVGASGTTITLIEESRKNLYGRFEPDERVAWTFRDGWMIFGSNASMLKQLLSVSSAATNTASAPAVVFPALAPGGTADASLWLNTPETSRLFKDAISAVTLSLLIRNPEGTQETRRRLDTAKLWIDRIQYLGAASAVVRQQDDRVQVEISITAPPDRAR